MRERCISEFAGLEGSLFGENGGEGCFPRKDTVLNEPRCERGGHGLGIRCEMPEVVQGCGGASPGFTHSTNGGLLEPLASDDAADDCGEAMV